MLHVPNHIEKQFCLHDASMTTTDILNTIFDGRHTDYQDAFEELVQNALHYLNTLLHANGCDYPNDLPELKKQKVTPSIKLNILIFKKRSTKEYIFAHDYSQSDAKKDYESKIATANTQQRMIIEEIKNHLKRQQRARHENSIVPVGKRIIIDAPGGNHFIYVNNLFEELEKHI